MKEEGVNFNVPKNIFYNPHMRFCRSFSSLAVGAIKEDLVLCDAFCASGIRGLRYIQENKNVKKLIFLDIEKNAIKAAKLNSRKNKIKADFKEGNISKLVFNVICDFAEIDPFGSPIPYIYDAFRFFNPLKKAFLSVTATDVAVTCGAKEKACMKNYHSKPMNNEFTHETAIRIIIKKIVETAAEFNMGVEPLVSLSHRHYQKIIFKCVRGAEKADECLNSLGYISYCPKCRWRNNSKFPTIICPKCKKKTDYAGPLWLGELHNKSFLKSMIAINSKRDYSDKEKIQKTLEYMQNEVGLPPYYYNIHKLCKVHSFSTVSKFPDIIQKLTKKRYKSTRTHFCDNSIKTNAPLSVIVRAIKQ